MTHDRKFQMTPFQRGLYRHCVNSQRQFDKKHGRVHRVTSISIDKDDPSKSTQHVASLDRTWPLNIAGIARILRVHTLVNRGEGRAQALRVIAELDDQGAKGVVAVTIDLLLGLVDFRFRYRSWGGADVGGSRRIADLLSPDELPALLALYRLCELLDADEKLGAHGSHRAFIAEALTHPEGVGFPKFTKEGCRDLIGCMHGADLAVRSGVPDGLRDGAWYAMSCTPFSYEPPDTLRIFIGQAYTLDRGRDDWNFREGGISVVAENGGWGRVVPLRTVYTPRPWLQAFNGKIFPWYAARLEKIQAYVIRPFNGTSELMAECLKTV